MADDAGWPASACLACCMQWKQALSKTDASDSGESACAQGLAVGQLL